MTGFSRYRKKFEKISLFGLNARKMKHEFLRVLERIFRKTLNNTKETPLVRIVLLGPLSFFLTIKLI